MYRIQESGLNLGNVSVRKAFVAIVCSIVFVATASIYAKLYYIELCSKKGVTAIVYNVSILRYFLYLKLPIKNLCSHNNKSSYSVLAF